MTLRASFTGYFHFSSPAMSFPVSRFPSTSSKSKSTKNMSSTQSKTVSLNFLLLPSKVKTIFYDLDLQLLLIQAAF